MEITDENLTEEELNEYLIITKNQLSKNESLFNDVHSDIKYLFDSVEDENCLEILNKLEEFSHIFNLINSVLSSFKKLIKKYLKYYEKNESKKLQILQLKNEIDSLKEELSNNFAEMDKKENEFNALHNDYMKVIKKLDSFNNNNSIDTSLDNINITRSNSNTEEIISKKSSKKKQSILKEMKDLKNNNDELTTTISILKNNLEDLKFENSNLKDKLILANQENENKEQKINFSESKENKMKNENNKLKSIVTNLKNENDSYYNEIVYLRSEVKHLSKKEQSQKSLNSYNFDYNSYNKNKAENQKNDELEKENGNIINLNTIGFSNEKEEKEIKQKKTNQSLNNIKITPKNVVCSMKKDFKQLLRITKLDNNKNDRAYSYMGNDSSKNDNNLFDNFMFDYFF